MIVRMLLIGMLAGCGASAETAPATVTRDVPKADAVRVETARLSHGEARMSLNLPGEIEGSEDVVLASALGGQVERVEVKRGQPVKKGQVIVRVDSDVYSAQFAQAEAQAELAASELKRVVSLGNLASESQLAQAQAQAKVTAAQKAQSQAQLSRAVLRAPFDGIVAAINVDPGEFCSPGQPVARIVVLDPVKVDLSVSDRDMVALRAGMPAQVSAAGAASIFAGVISDIGPAADMKTRAFPVDVLVPNPDGELLPGMIAQVIVDVAVQEGAFLLPQDFLVTLGDTRGVFVVDGDVARWRALTLGAIVQDSVIVEGGLEGGEDIVITGHRELVDGDVVLIGRRGECCTHGRVVFGG